MRVPSEQRRAPSSSSRETSTWKPHRQGAVPSRADASRFPAARFDFDPTPRFPIPAAASGGALDKKDPVFFFSPVVVRGAAAAPVSCVSDSAVAGQRGVADVGFRFGSAEGAGLLLQFGQQ